MTSLQVYNTAYNVFEKKIGTLRISYLVSMNKSLWILKISRKKWPKKKDSHFEYTL